MREHHSLLRLRLLQEHWKPPEVALPEGASLDEEVITTIIRVTDGPAPSARKRLMAVA